MSKLTDFLNRGPQSTSCNHDWELTAKTYAPPMKNLQTVIQDLKLLEKVVFGITTCVWTCHTCGEMRKEEVLGTDENQWFDIIEKVDKFGMQYIKDNEKVYGVAQWIPELDKVLVKQNG